MSYRDGIYAAMSWLSGEWVVAVLASLATRTLTYSELLDEINQFEEQQGWASHRQPLSHKVLGATLRRMRRNGLVFRSAEEGPSAFPRVWYELTPLGRRLLLSLVPLAKFAEDNLDAVEAARARYAEEEGMADGL